MGNSVDHPAHYNQGGPIGPDGSAQFEAIKLIEDLGWGFEFCMGNALKYALRAPHKGSEVEDLKKCQWYLLRASIHRGRIRPTANQKYAVDEALKAWGITMDSRLYYTVAAIYVGNPYEALDSLNIHLMSFGAYP